MKYVVYSPNYTYVGQVPVICDKRGFYKNAPRFTHMHSTAMPAGIYLEHKNVPGWLADRLSLRTMIERATGGSIKNREAITFLKWPGWKLRLGDNLLLTNGDHSAPWDKVEIVGQELVNYQNEIMIQLSNDDVVSVLAPADLKQVMWVDIKERRVPFYRLWARHRMYDASASIGSAHAISVPNTEQARRQKAYAETFMANSRYGKFGQIAGRGKRTEPPYMYGKDVAAAIGTKWSFEPLPPGKYDFDPSKQPMAQRYNVGVYSFEAAPTYKSFVDNLVGKEVIFHVQSRDGSKEEYGTGKLTIGEPDVIHRTDYGSHWVEVKEAHGQRVKGTIECPVHPSQPKSVVVNPGNWEVPVYVRDPEPRKFPHRMDMIDYIAKYENRFDARGSMADSDAHYDNVKKRKQFLSDNYGTLKIRDMYRACGWPA